MSEITDAKDLFDAVAWLVQTIGVYPSYPIRTAKLLVEATRAEKLQYVPSNDYTPFLNHDCKQILYLRKTLSREEKKAKYVHAFDKRNMFLSASNIELGENGYKVFSGDFRSDIVGLWCVDLSFNFSLIDGKTFVADVVKEGQKVWHYTPTLKLASDIGAQINVYSAYVWDKPKRPLERFYSIIRDGINTGVNSSGEIAAQKSLKSLYTRFIGWMAHEPNGRIEPYFRPDWRSLIIATANARLLYNLRRVEAEKGIKPFGIRFDACMFFSDEPDPEQAIPHPFTGAARTYRHIYTVDAEKVRAMIKDKKSVGQIDDACKRNEL